MRKQLKKTHLIRIGNSQGIRIPKNLLATSGIQGEVTISAKKSCLTIRPKEAVREGWEEAFQEMATSGDDVLLDEEVATLWEQKDWEWK